MRLLFFFPSLDTGHKFIALIIHKMTIEIGGAADYHDFFYRLPAFYGSQLFRMSKFNWVPFCGGFKL